MAFSTPSSFQRRYAFLRYLIWVYCILILIEGALRKWVLPSLSNPLLVIRDPLVLLIYICAVSKRCFPVNYFILGACVLAFFSFFFGLLSESSNLLITLYGMRVNYLHLPLLFIIPFVMTRSDVILMGKFFLWTSLPMTVLEVLQFYAPADHWLNINPGGVDASSLTGGMGRLRSSGTFSFTQGLSAYFIYVAAFFLSFLIDKKRISKVFLIVVGIALLIAIPASISRTLVLNSGILLIAATVSLYFKKNTSQLLFRFLCVLSIVTSLAAFLPVFDEGIASFQDRWVNATGTTGAEFKTNIVDRFLEGFSQSYHLLEYAGITGIGVGMGTNVATKLLTNQVGFLLAENEWSRIILELGSILGVAFILYRIGLFYYLLKESYHHLRSGNALPFLIFAACGFSLLNGQWGPPTNLGFAILGGGLVLAACNPLDETFMQKKQRRYYALKVLEADSVTKTAPSRGSYTF